jgi:hypothetical protein
MPVRVSVLAASAVLGWLNARIETWLPFSIRICMNGRTWLARRMDRAGIRYQQQDNCFPWVADGEQAQRLMDTQLQANWPELLDRIANGLNPIHDEIFQRFPLPYYWSTYQSEWATDVVFRKAEDLKRLYPLFVHHAGCASSTGTASVCGHCAHSTIRTGSCWKPSAVANS